MSVSASDAGTTVACPCGRAVRVPRLSQLRVSQGLDAAESNVRDTIARMIREGTLPWGDCCAVSGVPTDNVMLFDVLCEQSYVKGSASRKWGTVLIVLGFFVCWPIAIFMWLIGRDLHKTQVERVGHDVVMTIPVKVRMDSQTSVARYSQSRLRKMLSSIPIYERLFNEYSGARIHPR
jgi:hypothetical protein